MNRLFGDGPVRLTKLATKGGCAAKWSPGELGEILREIAPTAPEELLLGFETSDDAAVYKLRDDLAAVLTLDFFTPVVDDPYEFGAIAAANALSDVFAMGATPICGLNILAMPIDIGSDVVKEVLRGGNDKATEAGAFIVGGHTIDDDEPKYGLSVFGVVDPEKIVRNEGAKHGDLLFFTKRIGTGILSSAQRAEMIGDKELRPAIEMMMELNKAGAEAMLEAHAHAATDVTGFGIAGHLHEMLEASGMSARLYWEKIPMFDGVWEFAQDFVRPGKSFHIAKWASNFVRQGVLDDAEYTNRMGIVCDPQTSGGLLVAVAPDEADTFVVAFKKRTGREPALIGEVMSGPVGHIFLR